MWTSYEALCEMGATDIDPTSVFGVRPNEIDQLQQRLFMQSADQEDLPLQEKSVLTPHLFTVSPPITQGGTPSGGLASIGRSMVIGTPAGIGGPKGSLFQMAQKPTAESGSTAILPSQLHFDTPNLTPISLKQDASFVQHNPHLHYHSDNATGNVKQKPSSIIPGAGHTFGDSLNAHTLRRAKEVAARMYYKPSPETPQYYPHHGQLQLAKRGMLLKGTTLRTSTPQEMALDSRFSETPTRRGGRPSGVSTVRKPRALFLSENKAIRVNTNDLNYTSTIIGDDGESSFDPTESRTQYIVDGRGFDIHRENHSDEEQLNMMITEENGIPHAVPGIQEQSVTAFDAKPVLSSQCQMGLLMDEQAIIESHTAVKQILELLCLLGAGYWRLCQVSMGVERKTRRRLVRL